MLFPFFLLKLLKPKPKYVWFPVRFLHETEKGVLVWNQRKIWIAKARIEGVRLKKKVFEVYVREIDTV